MVKSVTNIDAPNTLFILGMHRSGTSAISRALSNLGVEFGDRLLAPAEDNPKGFWEDQDVVALNDKILARQGLSWSSIRSYDNLALSEDKGFTDQVAALISSKAGGVDVWGVKDPRLCLLMPQWHRGLESLGAKGRYLFIFRNPLSVAASLQKRNELLQDHACALWLSYALSALNFLHKKDISLLEYDVLLQQPETELKRISVELGLEVSDTMLLDAEQSLVTDLRHNFAAIDNVAEGSPIVDLACRVYQLLQSGNKKPKPESFYSALKALETEFIQMQPLLRYIDVLAQVTDQCAVKERDWLTRCMQSQEHELKKCAAELDRRANEIITLEEEVVARGRELTKLTDELIARGHEIKRLNTRVSELQVEKDLLGNTLSDANAQLPAQQVDTEKELRRVREIQALTQQKLNQANVSLDQLYASRSWRVMAPVRGVSRAVQSLKSVAYHSAYRLVRGKFLPAKLKLWLINHFRVQFARFQHDTSNISNRKSMEYLARDRQKALIKVISPKAVQELPSIDISIVTYNSERWIDSFFTSLAEQHYPLERINVIVVDNGSTDKTLEKVNAIKGATQGRLESFQVFKRPNKGFGGGHNFAIKAGSSEFVLVTNIDLEYEADSIVRVVRAALEDADSGKVASWELRQKPYEHPKYYDPVTLETAWSSHACILMRREAFETVGGYEKKIFMYGEDVELSYRLRDYGYLVKYCPAAVVWHHTYEHAGQVKALQFFGSTLANAYLRLRYGTFTDILAIIGMYAYLLGRGAPVHGARRGLLKNLVKIVSNTPYFLLSRKKSEHRFPFRAWDYEMCRDGAFYVNERLESSLPLVSVITRTYKGREKWLRESITSVLNQTYPNIELVVTEDGGNTHQALIEDIKHRLPDGKVLNYYPQPKNGRSYAGNQGLAAAKGRYLMFLDDDDLLFPDHIEVLVNEMQRNSEISGAYSLSWEVQTSNIDLEREGPHYQEEMHLTPDVFKQEFSREVIQHHNFIPIQAILFKRELFEEHGGFDEEMDYLEDWNLWVRYSSDTEFKLINKTTSLFRTPHDMDERVRRHKILHESYELAMRKQKEFFAAREKDIHLGLES